MKANIIIEIVDNGYIPFGLKNEKKYKKKAYKFRNTEFSFDENGIKIFPKNKKGMFFNICYMKSIKLENIDITKEL